MAGPDHPAETPRPDPIVELGPPLTAVPWSPSFITQSIEILPLFLRDRAISWLRPEHGESLRIGWPAGTKPGEAVVAALSRYGLVARLVHSTSWRHVEDRVVLTYVAVVEPPEAAVRHMAIEPVPRADLARGDEFAPPPQIEVGHVLEHALRHLAWLIEDDATVARAIADWKQALSAYHPEPFRALAGTQP